MKKALLYTTALVGFTAASAFAAEGSNDSAMALSFQGASKFEVGTKSQDRNHKTALKFSPNQKSTGFYTTQKASLKAEGKADSLTYGAVIRLQTVGNMSDGMSDARNDRSHLYIDTDMGSVQLGSNFAASKLMQIDASTIASATGGIDGDFANFASRNNYSVGDASSSNTTLTMNGKNVTADAMGASIVSSAAITNVDTLSNRLDGTTGEQSRKITYLSPRISGLQLGVSFSPDFNNTGDNDLIGKGSVDKDGRLYNVGNMYLGLPVRLKNVWSMGLNYTNTFNDVNVAFSAVADRGTAVKQNVVISKTENDVTTTSSGQAKFHNLSTYSLGLVVGTNGFSVAGSYHNDGKSLTPQASGSKFSSSWWTAGVAYENGPMSTSLTYLQGKKKLAQASVIFNGNQVSGSQTVKSQIVSLGADYEVAPGLKPFAEVSMVKYKPQNQYVSGYDKNNAKATVFLLGTKVKF